MYTREPENRGMDFLLINSTNVQDTFSRDS